MSEADISITAGPVVLCTYTTSLLPLIHSQTMSRTTLMSCLAVHLSHRERWDPFVRIQITNASPTSMTELARI